MRFISYANPHRKKLEDEQLGEIKSTIELMMERTRGMTMSQEERDRLRVEDLRKRAKGYRLRLLGDPTKTEEILSAVDSDSPEDRALLESFIWQEMVENLPTDKEILHHIDLMRGLPPAKSKTQILEKLRASYKDSLKDSAEDRKKWVAQEKKKLAALGISGSAVMPKLPKDGVPNVDFSSRITTLKKQLLEETP
jgi:hypothetical protein